jgi:hypothetical protein
LQGLAKARPDAPASLVFSPAECAVLERMAAPPSPSPATALSLREASHRLARLGGYTARACDGPPGPKTIWLGWQRLGDYIAAHRLFCKRPLGDLVGGRGKP